MMTVMPKVMQSLPDMIKAVVEAQKHSKLPKADMSHLSPEQISKLSKLLGIPKSELSKPAHNHAAH